jgi:hypothetical protein
MLINLTKIITSDSLLGIGTIRRGVEPYQLISGGHSPRLIAESLNGLAFAAGRTNPRNAFCVEAANAYYLYAHREYKGYRAFFRRFFKLIPSGCDVDHVLSRSLAERIGVPYLLLAAVPKNVNRSHGTIERRGLALRRRVFLGKTFPLDERMFHKVMARRLGVRQEAVKQLSGYRPGEGHALGLTLKQRGIWNLAFCIDAVDAGHAPALSLRRCHVLDDSLISRRRGLLLARDILQELR